MNQPGQLRRRLRIAFAGLLVADAVLLAFLLSPFGPSREQARTALARAQSRYVVLRAQVAGLRKLQGEIRASQRQARRLLTTGMPGQRTADFRLLGALQSMAQTTGVDAASFHFYPARKAHLGLRRLSITMRITGQYAALVRFINHVERAPMFFIVRQVALSTRNHGPQGNGLALAIQLESYVRTATATPAGPQGSAE